jgi:hypothetical protein
MRRERAFVGQRGEAFFVESGLVDGIDSKASIFVAGRNLVVYA